MTNSRCMKDRSSISKSMRTESRMGGIESRQAMPYTIEETSSYENPCSSKRDSKLMESKATMEVSSHARPYANMTKPIWQRILRDIALPDVERSKTEIVTSRHAIPYSVRGEPHCTRPRKKRNEPRCNTSGTNIVLPNQVMPKTTSILPRRARL